MKAITVRGIKPELARVLKEKAASEGKSINLLVQEMLKNNLGLEKGKKYSRVYDDLDDLLGKWSNDEYERIDAAIRNQRRIDPELWT